MLSPVLVATFARTHLYSKRHITRKVMVLSVHINDSFNLKL
jgi:hypothetical protein